MSLTDRHRAPTSHPRQRNRPDEQRSRSANHGRGPHSAIGAAKDWPRQSVRMSGNRFSADDARKIGEQIGIDWSTSRFDVEQFRMGLDVELEHGRRDPATNVSDDDEITTGK